MAINITKPTPTNRWGISLKVNSGVPVHLQEDFVHVLITECARTIFEQGDNPVIPPELASYGYISILAALTEHGLPSGIMAVGLSPIRSEILNFLILKTVYEPTEAVAEKTEPKEVTIKLSVIADAYLRILNTDTGFMWREDIAQIMIHLVTDETLPDMVKDEPKAVVEEKTSTIKEDLQEILDSAREAADEVVDDITDTCDDIKDAVTDSCNEHPTTVKQTTSASDDGLGVLGTIALCALAGAAIYGGYRYFGSDVTEDTVIVDLDNCI